MAIPRARQDDSSGGLADAKLLVVSLALFGYAAYLFIDPEIRPLPLPSASKPSKSFSRMKRFEAALDLGNKLLASGNLKPAEEGHVHLLLAQVLEGAQKDHHIDLRSNHNLHHRADPACGWQGGEKETADLYRRARREPGGDRSSRSRP